MKDTIAHNLDAHEEAFQRASVRNTRKEDPAITRRFDIAREVSGANGISSAADATLLTEVSGLGVSEKKDRLIGEAWSGVERILKGNQP